jgi:hypothetical protein
MTGFDLYNQAADHLDMLTIEGVFGERAKRTCAVEG